MNSKATSPSPGNKAGSAAEATPARRCRVCLPSILFLGFAVALVAVVVRRLLALPLEAQLGVVPDDTFYYLGPALNVAQGKGPTSDGITITSGFHPLWEGLLILLAGLTGRAPLALYEASLCVSGLLHALTAWLLFLVGRRHTSGILAFCWAAFYLVWRAPLAEALGGTEAALLAFLLTLFAFTSGRATPGGRDGWGLGVLLGLLFLARTDSVFFAAGWYLVAMVASLAKGASVRDALRVHAASMIVAAVTILPWFVICWLTYGSPLQNSMLIKQLWRDSQVEQVGAYTLTASMIKEWFSTVLAFPYRGKYLLLLFIGAGIATAPSHAPAGEKQRPPLGAHERFLLALLFYVVAAGVFYATHFSFVRSWYYVPGRLLLPFLAIWLGSVVLPRTGARARTVLAACTVLLLCSHAVPLARGTLSLAWARAPEGSGNLYTLAQAVQRHVGKADVVGAYSSGVLSYFSQRTVVNLDGLNNNQILHVYTDRTMDRYVEQMGIRFIADYESVLGNLRGMDKTGRLLGRLRVVERIPAPGSGYGDLVLWRVENGAR